jgi:hypothetical protein
VLAKEELDVKDILEFAKHQRGLIEDEFGNVDNDALKTSKLVLQYNLYGKIMSLIESPKHEREALIRYLETLLK